MSVKLIDFQLAQQELQREIDKLRGGGFVTVGIHEDANTPVGEGEMTMAALGATLNFGADIDHPGGTSYGYATENDAANRKVSFLKRGAGYAVLGVTQPHKINIPARPWLQPGVQSATPDIIDTLAAGVESGASMNQTLKQVGAIAAGAVQVYMTELRDPPNAPSTIRAKGSDNPLINTGALRGSVSYKVTPTKPEEGL